MSRSTTARRRLRRTLAFLAVGLAVATAAVIGASAAQSPPSSATPFGEIPRGDLPGPATDGAATETDGAMTEADGVLPDGVTVFDDRYAGVTNLDPELLRALRDAATDASADGVEFLVNSGWRSAEYQDRLLREALATYGSEAEAARWVATADTSAHVSGDAVDLGATDAAWLSEFGAAYGLCPTYDNEPWHYELRPEAVGSGCPATYADPTQDPRMQQ
ncbi:M15 family metallopeptidase [Agromyces sp. NPDC004153]